MYKVVDLSFGLGGMSKPFEDLNCKIVSAFNIRYNCRSYSSLIHGNISVQNIRDYNDFDPNDILDSDILLSKIHLNSFSSLKKMSELSGSYLINCIKIKKPKIFLLESSINFLRSKRGTHFVEFLKELESLNYRIYYQNLSLREYSGYPLGGQKLYIVGISQCLGNNEFYFPSPCEREKDFLEVCELGEYSYKDCEDEVHSIEGGEFFLSTPKGLVKTKLIEIRSMYEIAFKHDGKIRKFTQNELAKLQGLYYVNYNEIKNSTRTYREIKAESNGYVIGFIAQKIIEYLENSKESPTRITKSSNTETFTNKLMPKTIITNLNVTKLKGLRNLELDITNKVLAIMGVNGSGKSTILHALACSFSPYQNGENHKFSYFFTPNPDASWNDSLFSLTISDEDLKKKSKRTYSKRIDRWTPRYSSRPIKDVYYLGVSSFIPMIEIERQVTFINYSTDTIDDNVSKKILNDAAYILNKDYNILTKHTTAKKEFIGVKTKGNLKYSSLSMGAGEQKIIKVLELVYTARQYSLILIDELDLLLHVTALRRLILKIRDIADRRNLQMIFTSHSTDIFEFQDIIDIRYIQNTSEKSLVFNHSNTDLIYELNGCCLKRLKVIVEDNFAACIIRKIAEKEGLLRELEIIKFGSASNAFTLAAAYILEKRDIQNVLIVLDGDVYRDDKEKEKIVKKVLSGTEIDHDDKVTSCINMIKQFNLPKGKSPEEYLFSLLHEIDDNTELVNIAKRVYAVSNKHDWIGELAERMGFNKETIIPIILEKIYTSNSKWRDYVSPILEWLCARK